MPTRPCRRDSAPARRVTPPPLRAARPAAPTVPRATVLAPRRSAESLRPPAGPPRQRRGPRRRGRVAGAGPFRWDGSYPIIPRFGCCGFGTSVHFARALHNNFARYQPELGDEKNTANITVAV